MPEECEALLPDGSDFMAEEMGFGQGWNPFSVLKGHLSMLKRQISNKYVVFYRFVVYFYTYLSVSDLSSRSLRRRPMLNLSRPTKVLPRSSGQQA